MRYTRLAAVLALLALAGCMSPNFERLIPPNKDAHIEVVAPLYGHIIIDTRVQGSTNPLPVLKTPQ